MTSCESPRQPVKAIPVSVFFDGDLAVIRIDNPPVNATSHAVRSGLVDALSAANVRPQVRAIVLACAGSTFVAGADITEFGKPPQAPFLTDVATAIENSNKPVVAALHGTVLGGGLEIALAAHGRVALPGALFGLPEVTLGIIPGAGATQRLPRLVGMEIALNLITGGQRISAAEALDFGLVDRLSGGDRMADARALALSLVGRPLRRTGRLPVPPFDAANVAGQIERVRKKARGQIAPVKAAEMVLRAAEVDLAQGLADERSAFLELSGSSQAAALRHVFAAERAAGKVPGLAGAKVAEIRTVGVVGAGLMGAGIAVACLDAGFDVRVVEREGPAAEDGRARIAAIYARLCNSGRITKEMEVQRISRLEVHAELGALAPCDLVIEAVFDDLKVKQELLESLSAIVRPDAIVATNTSYLNPDVLACAIEHPARFLGIHFFSPANVMRLVEIVRRQGVSDDVLLTVSGFVKRLGKLGVVTGVCEGFIGNRIFSAYREECDFMLEEGALPHEIDDAMEAFGFPMGLYAVNDMVGLDISWARRKRLAGSRDPAKRYVVIADRLCEAGRLGRKTGKGYYDYADGQRAVDPEVVAIIESASNEGGVIRRAFTADEIRERVQGAIVAEGLKLLKEGIARQASDIDVVMIHGYGYPNWRGGPMYEAGILDRLAPSTGKVARDSS